MMNMYIFECLNLNILLYSIQLLVWKLVFGLHVLCCIIDTMRSSEDAHTDYGGS
jgi:hypothetical protein